MNQIREILKINEEELSRGIAGTSASWHAKYANSAWVYVGNLDVKLTEGDVVAVLSEYGEIDDFHLVREEDTGKSKGFAFCKYEDSRSCVIAVDNLCGVKLLGRSLRVDHVENYRLPKNLQDKEEELQQLLLKKQGLQGHAYEGKELANEFSLHQGHDVFAKPAPAPKPAPKGTDPPGDIVVVDEGKLKRKEEKRQRKREREQKRMEREEKRREKRAKKMHIGDDNNNDDDDNEGGKKRGRRVDDSREERKHSRKKHKSASSKEHKSKKPDKDKERKKRKKSSRSSSPPPKKDRAEAKVSPLQNDGAD